MLHRFGGSSVLLSGMPNDQPLLVLAEFVCSEAGDGEFRSHLERTLAETRAVEGCLHAVVWTRPDRRYQFSTLWRDRESVQRWIDNEFHRQVLMPGFRKWCTQGWFGEYRGELDHLRAIRCAKCGRWAQGKPGWSEVEPKACRNCGAALP
ncbi:MAG: putative quinol monooxygenase [Candidatus Binatia bacterium]